LQEQLQPKEEQFRLLVDAVKDYAIFMLDPQGRIASWNSGAQGIKGYTAEEVIGKSFEIFFTPEDVDHGKPAELLRRAREQGRATDEGIRLRKGGGRFLAESLLTPILAEGGVLRGYTKITRDITDKRALDELKASRRQWQETERQFRALTDTAPVLIWMTGDDFACTYVNQTWLDFTGGTLEQALGEGWTSFLHPQDVKGYLDFYHGSFMQRKTFKAEYRLRRHDGAYRWILSTGAPRFSAEGTFLGFVGSGTDIHERKELEQELLYSRNQLSVILQGVDNPITAQSPSGRFVFANETAAHFLGFADAGELLAADPKDVSLRYEVLDEAGRPLPREKLPSQAALRGEDSEPTIVRYRERGKNHENWSIVKAKPIFDAAGKVSLAVNFFQDITDIKQREMEERRAKEQLRIILGGIQDAIIAQQTDGKVLFINDSAARLFGFPSAEAAYAVEGTPAAEELRKKVVVTDEYGKPLAQEKTPARVAMGGVEAPAMTLRFKMDSEGPEHWVVTRATPVFGEDGKVQFIIQIIHDITEVRETEERFRQAQKMEAVGRLAGGIAHDFNNLLTVINGYSDLVLSKLSPEGGGESFANLSEVREAGRRAASLTQQLLAFSRKQLLAPKVLDLNEIVQRMDTMLRRLIGEDVRLVTRLSPHLPPVRVDVSQMEQVILNLAVNARDAMPTGGELTMETGASDAPDGRLPERFAEPLAGRQVKLTVKDTGTGMSEAVRQRIFEPFFTTKETGKGTGLGLAMVYGIVRQSGGNIYVTSEPGKGSIFEVYLPAASPETKPEEAAAAKTPAQGAPSSPPEEAETVLVVEDEEAVSRLIQRILHQGGYNCLLADSGEQALEIMRSRAGAVDLLLTDVVLKGIDGPALAGRLRVLNPSLRVLYMSGYMDDNIDRHGVLYDGVELINKPFSAQALLERIGSLLKV
jgi:two-component system cell cycle sensor histidine kinase/response regulator CckA